MISTPPGHINFFLSLGFFAPHASQQVAIAGADVESYRCYVL